jgi:mRNA interferase MazF
MVRDFKKWFILKELIEKYYLEKLFREREIWWCSLGANVGYEQDGKHNRFERPVLILRKFNKGMFWGLPLSSRPKKGLFYFSFFWKEVLVTALLSQIRVLSPKRLIRRMGKININTFTEIRGNIRGLLEIKTDPLGGPRVPDGN